MILTPPLEDYLETIGELCHEGGGARVKDVAARRAVSNPSVVRALRTLKRERLVVQEPYGLIRLTGRGQRVAGAILRRHRILADFLQNVLGLDAETAAQDACRIEHAVSPRTVRRLRAAARFLGGEAHADLDWRREFALFCGRGARGNA